MSPATCPTDSVGSIRVIGSSLILVARAVARHVRIRFAAALTAPKPRDQFVYAGIERNAARPGEVAQRGDDAATASALDAQIAALPIPDRINGLGAVVVRGHWALMRQTEQEGNALRARRLLDWQGKRAI